MKKTLISAAIIATISPTLAQSATNMLEIGKVRSADTSGKTYGAVIQHGYSELVTYLVSAEYSSTVGRNFRTYGLTIRQNDTSLGIGIKVNIPKVPVFVGYGFRLHNINEEIKWDLTGKVWDSSSMLKVSTRLEAGVNVGDFTFTSRWNTYEDAVYNSASINIGYNF